LYGFCAGFVVYDEIDRVLPVARQAAIHDGDKKEGDSGENNEKQNKFHEPLTFLSDPLDFS
jgi:hypothetical protein